MVASRPSPRLIGAAVLLGLLLSQPGHALGYLIAYGGRSFAIQSHGAHAYFPTTLHLSFELLATLTVGTMALLGVGRLALGAALGLERQGSVRPHELVFVLAIVQLNAFMFQELAELTAAHAVAETHWLLATLLVAAAGQLPVALLAGLLLAWCGVRLRVAVDAIRSSRRVELVLLTVEPTPVVAAPAPESPLPFDALATVIRRRGPPLWSLSQTAL